jgi:HNH endonuclease
MPLQPAWVKNISRRVLWAALEADITKEQRTEMVDFFAQKCAYCETPLKSRWHADHLLPIDGGGFNNVSNRVPACPRCNEHEKRDMEWLRFLELKSHGDKALFEARRTRIEAWMTCQKPLTFPVTEEQRAAWKKEVDTLAVAIDEAWKRLKDTRAG